jgi:hypothetical protein
MLLAAQRRSAPTPTKCALRYMHCSLKTSQVEHQGASARGGGVSARTRCSNRRLGPSATGQLRSSNKRHRRRDPGPQHSPEMSRWVAQWYARPCTSIYLDDLHRVPPPQKGQPGRRLGQGELEQLPNGRGYGPGIWDDAKGRTIWDPRRSKELCKGCVYFVVEWYPMRLCTGVPQGHRHCKPSGCHLDAVLSQAATRPRDRRRRQHPR